MTAPGNGHRDVEDEKPYDLAVLALAAATSMIDRNSVDPTTTGALLGIGWALVAVVEKLGEISATMAGELGAERAKALGEELVRAGWKPPPPKERT